MGCEVKFGNAIVAGKRLDMFHEMPAQPLALCVGIDGDVHEVGRGATDRHDGAAGNPAVAFGDEDMMVANVLGETAGDIREVRQA